MKIAVLTKYCPDSEAVIKVTGGQIDSSGVKYSVSPYDEYAVEEALRITEAAGEGEVVVFSVGPERAAKGIKDELARGAHRAVHIVTEDEERDNWLVAGLLAAALKEESPDLILCGWKGIDYDCGFAGIVVAELLGLPHVTLVTKLDLQNGTATCHRQVDGGEEIVEVALPAVIAAQKGLNEPRYPSLKGIMAAKKKPVDKMKPADLVTDFHQGGAEYLDFEKPPSKQPGKRFEGPEAVREVVRLLRDEAKVI